MSKICVNAAGAEPTSPEPEQLPVSMRAMGLKPMRYLDALNPEQREAVETLDGPLLVLAGAGTGKTRVLTTRIAHILSLGRARPSQILAVTFTNKAAREMKGRVGELIGGVVEGMPWLGTFHAIGVKILRRHAELVDLKPSFTVLDTDDQIRLLKQLLEAENIDEKRWPARLLAAMIDGWKNRGLDAEARAGGRESSPSPMAGRRDLYALYQHRLKELNAADFGDLLLENLRLFQEHPDVLAQYQAALPLHAGRRVSGHQCRAIFVAQAARRRAAAISAASATTTSRSMAGAAPRSTTSSASRPTFPAPRSSGSSATTARPAISSARPRA